MTQRDESGYFLHPPGRLSRGAVLDVGLKCVHSCKFCYYSYLDKSDDQFRGMRRAEFRTLEECKEIVRRLRANGFVNFDVTGGEPTLHQGIIEIMRYAHQDLGLKGRIITLGQYLMRRMKNCKHEKLIDDLLEAGLTNFLFSMHAVDEPLFERLTGESWLKQRRAMEYLDEKGFQFTTNTTVVEWNYRSLPDIAREILRHGIYLHNFIIMNAYYEWNRGGKAFGVQAKYSDIHPYLKEAVEILESHDVAVNIRYAPLCAVRGMEKNLVGMVGVRYDPYEWMNVAGHFGGTPEQCAAPIAITEGGIEAHLAYRDVAGVHDNGVRVTGMRGANLKHFAEPCARCAARPVCDGIDPNYLRHHGPAEFIPYAEPQRAPLHKDRYTYLMPFLVKTEQYADMKSVVKEAFAAWRKMSPPRQPAAACALPSPMPARAAGDKAAPKVSVVVTCYNYGRYLKEAVGSVLAQTYRDLEVVIVDDGSTDNTRAVIEEIVAAHPQAAIRVIHQPNSGQPAHARNRGIREARGEYILCLDADDMIAPAMIERCVAVLEANPQVAIAYTDRLDFDGVTQLVRAAPYDARRLPYQNHLSYCALYRRKVWEDVGGYRDNVKGCEDWDFWVAACARGHYGYYLPEPLFLYRRHDSGLYQHALAHFDEKRAQIVLNNRSLYRPEDIAWAEAVLKGRRAAPAADGPGPLVTVVVPTRDRPRLLKDALASLVAQDYPRWEAIVVNDGGEDITPIAQAADPAGRIRVVTHRASLGPGAARNTALKLARGEIVCYLDDDDIFRPDHLSTVVAALASLPKPGFVYTDAEIVEEVIEGGVRRLLGHRGNPYRHESFSRERLLVANYIPINTWAHHWELVERAGFFAEGLPVLEDWDFLLKLLRHATPQHLPRTTVEVRHREAPDSVTRRGRPHMTATWREIYARSDDLADEAIRAQRQALLARLEASDVRDEAHAAYRKWVEKHTLEEIDGQLYAERMMLEWRHPPQFHFVTVVSRDRQALLADTLDALAAQLYRSWRLTIIADFPPPVTLAQADTLAWVQIAPGMTPSEAVNRAVRETPSDWVAWIPPGLRAAPQLLLCVADHIHLELGWRLIYSDSDTMDERGERRDPRFRPDFNLDLLRSMPYLGELCLVERSVLLDLGGYGTDVPGAESYDLTLKVLDACGEQAIGHISDVLYHLPAAAAGVPGFDEASGKRALEAHLARRAVRAEVGAGLLPGTFRVVYRHDTQPLVSVIIPTRDRLEVLEPCIESLLAKTDYPHYEVLVVDNQSEDPDTLAYLEALARRERVRLLRYPHPFNFAAICNMAAREARGEYLLLLNNDTQVVQPEWLTRMMQHAQRPEVGIVGARLVFPETGKIQHAGVVLGLDTVAGHPFVRLLDLHEPGYMGRAQVDQNYSAVTGACLLVRRALYEQVGGMDEERFRVSFNDIDLCLKVGQAGYKIVWTPYATLVHHGHATQRAVNADSLMKQAQAVERDEQERAAMLDKWLPQIAHDPAYNRHLSLVYHDFRPEADVVINWDPRRHDRPRVLGLSPGGGVGEYRVNAPLRAISRAGYAQTDVVQAPKFHQARLLTVSEAARAAPDVLIYHSSLSDGQLESMRRIRRHLSIPFVYGLDDLVTNVPPKSSSYRYAYKDARARLRRALAMCERLVVTTEPLAELARGMIGEIHLVPNYLERSQWEGLVSQRRQGPRPRVGWAGGQQHQGDLELIAEVVEATAREVDWVFLGMCPERLRPYVKEVYGFEPGFRDYLARLASLNLDLAVAPLELHPFNEAKSNLRLLEYGMLGWPVVCTDILPYQGAPVCRVPNEPRRWIEAIRERVHDLDAAEREGERLRAWVQTHYLLEDHLEEWLAALGLRAARPAAWQAGAPRQRAVS